MTAKTIMSYMEDSSAVRAMFEDGAKMIAEVGAENVYDFSLGNPSVPAPKEVNEAIADIIKKEESTFLHGYNQTNSGYADVRETVANHLNRLHGTAFKADNILMTVGAAGGLNIAIKVLADPGDEILAFAPYFAEYRNYARNHGTTIRAVPPNFEDFQPNLAALEEMIDEKTAAVIINSPNNPTGVIYSEETLKKLGEILERKSAEIGRQIFIISDEPYRELVYTDTEVPFVTKFYRNTIVGYSWSKSLSLPGERIGYLVMPSEIDDFENCRAAANLATRILGFVNAPTLMQRAVAACIDCSTDVEVYNKNRIALYEGLTEIGYDCVKPEGAFYLWMKSPFEDEKEFCALGKKYHILMVPGWSFACPGYVRLAYCVPYDVIVRSMPAFQAMMDEIRGK